MCSSLVDFYLQQNEDGKIRSTENKEKEQINGTYCEGHVTTYLHHFHLLK